MHKVSDSGDGRKYRTEIPNVVFTLGLSPYELTLYLHLKRTAGESGECWKSTATLAKETGMSAGMVSKAKDSLQIPRMGLNKKPLIRVKEEDNPHGGKPRHLITLTDIWPNNFSYFSSSQDELASSPDELASSCGELASSPHEIKKEPSRKEPKKKATTSVVAARTGKPETPVSVCREITKRSPNEKQRSDITAQVKDLVRWREILEQYMLEGQPPQHVDWMLQRYHGNGKNHGPPAKGEGWKARAPTLEDLAVADGITVEEARKRYAGNGTGEQAKGPG